MEGRDPDGKAFALRNAQSLGSLRKAGFGERWGKMEVSISAADKAGYMPAVLVAPLCCGAYLDAHFA